MTKKSCRIFAAIACAMGLWAMATTSYAQHASPHDAITIAGQWRVDLAAHHNVSMRMTLEQDKTTIKGTLQDPHGGEMPLAGTFAGHKLALAVTSGTEMELAGELKADGTMAGSLSGARGDFEWTATRIKSR
jgi:hypothetical protein